ncbi:predicted protein [Sparassis crispa]|uniref:Uncharacterized protein n=1 Tax=Sparassis crispa TaxID=139825 RepID=A0A401GHJ6_9APHY|nr:predicted protein [Sparassis crispa]GBE81674.1 predicted protein [Sparassis crispa]
MSQMPSAEAKVLLPDYRETSLSEELTISIVRPLGDPPSVETQDVQSAESVSSEETFKFPTGLQTESPISEDPSQSLESSRSSFSTSASASTSLDTPSVSTDLVTSSSSSLPSSSPSVPSILRTSSSLIFPVHGTVAFAPLPMIEPRRRQSTIALGVAARSRILRHRRLLREQGINPDDVSMPAWSDEVQIVEDPEQGALRQRHRHRHTDIEEDPFGAEDAFASIGKLVKGAGRSFWRRVALKQQKSPVSEEQSPASEEKLSASEEKSPASEEKSPVSDRLYRPLHPRPWQVKSLLTAPTTARVRPRAPSTLHTGLLR